MGKKKQTKAEKELQAASKQIEQLATARLHNTLIAIGMAEIAILLLTEKFGRMDDKVMLALVSTSPHTLKDLALKFPSFQTEADFYAWIGNNLLGWYPQPKRKKTKSKEDA